MNEKRRVDLIFPRSGQVLPVYIPEPMLEWVARRNIQILLSLYGRDALRACRDHVRNLNLYPS